jgi:hypothetical protein
MRAISTAYRRRDLGYVKARSIASAVRWVNMAYSGQYLHRNKLDDSLRQLLDGSTFAVMA